LRGGGSVNTPQYILHQVVAQLSTTWSGNPQCFDYAVIGSVATTVWQGKSGNFGWPVAFLEFDDQATAKYTRTIAVPVLIDTTAAGRSAFSRKQLFLDWRNLEM
jgi:hypothetical protein